MIIRAIYDDTLKINTNQWKPFVIEKEKKNEKETKNKVVKTFFYLLINLINFILSLIAYHLHIFKVVIVL